jgi:hypothetical protein
MATERTYPIEGFKTFFVLPDLAIMPEELLKNCFLAGFETHYLLDDPYLDLRDKVRSLFSVFPDVILFFNIDRDLKGDKWPRFIASLKAEFGDRAMIGVLYNKAMAPAARSALERLYLYDIGITCGCIPIGYDKAANLEKLLGVLVANQANGRRKYLRMICAGSSVLNLNWKGSRFEGEIRDISISHFSCVFTDRDPAFQMYEKISDIQIKIPGAICTISAVVFTKRVCDDKMLYVFVFRDSMDRNGLDPDSLRRVNNAIFSHFSLNVESLLHRAFEARRKLLAAKTVQFPATKPSPVKQPTTQVAAVSR